MICRAPAGTPFGSEGCAGSICFGPAGVSVSSFAGKLPIVGTEAGGLVCDLSSGRGASLRVVEEDDFLFFGNLAALAAASFSSCVLLGGSLGSANGSYSGARMV